jgi:hypothetical protein
LKCRDTISASLGVSEVITASLGIEVIGALLHASPRLSKKAHRVKIVDGLPVRALTDHMEAQLGRDVDKPRNLAKSVTVE